MKRLIFALLIFVSTSGFAQRGKPLELVSVENNVWHFRMGNVEIAAKCGVAFQEISEGNKVDAECGGVIPDLGMLVGYCDITGIALQAAHGEEINEHCYEATTGQLELALWFNISGTKTGARQILYESYRIVTMQKSKGATK